MCDCAAVCRLSTYCLPFGFVFRFVFVFFFFFGSDRVEKLQSTCIQLHGDCVDVLQYEKRETMQNNKNEFLRIDGQPFDHVK